MTEPLACKLVDTHAHLADPRLAGRLPAVLATAREHNVARIIAVATTATDSRRVVALAAEHPEMIRAAVGIHPVDAVEATAADWDTIIALADDEAVVAIGETGLDRHWDRTPFPIQQDYFARHLDLAHRSGLPIIIHSRDCHRDLVDQLAQLGRPIRGVVHSFTGDWAAAEEILSFGLHLSFAGMVTFANRSLDTLREAAARVPAGRLLVETDSPYLAPVPHRGQPNEPGRVVHTATKIAALRGMTLQELAAETTATAQDLFRRARLG